MLAPHLPSPKCDIKSHARWLDIKCVVASSLLGLLAGLSGASIVLGWIWPNYGGGDTWIVSRSQGSSAGANLEEVVYKESTERVFSIYRASAKLDSLEYLPESEKIGEAIAISSDGWLAMYVRKDTPLVSAAKLRALSSDGNVFSGEKYLLDSQSRIAYIKISRTAAGEGEDLATTQFKVASFEDAEPANQEIFIHENGGWHFSRVGYINPFAPSLERLDSAPSFAYTIDSNFQTGSVAITGRGRVIGFVNDASELLPVSALTRIMPGVLSSQKIEYPSLGVTGWFTSVQPAVSGNNQISGFVVASVWSGATKLRRGDVITEINGQIVRDESLWYNIGDKEATLTITRSGKVFDLPVSIIKASPDLK